MQIPGHDSITGAGRLAGDTQRDRRQSSLWASPARALALVLFFATTIGPAHAWVTTELISASQGGGSGNDSSASPTISATGQYVAFETLAADLTSADTNGMSDVFVRGRSTKTNERVSVSSDGAQANGASHAPSLSCDGRYVTFESTATNLVPDDVNGTSDVFVRDRIDNMTERVSVATGGGERAEDSFAPAISCDGHVVAFRSPAADGTIDVLVHDRAAETTERVAEGFEFAISGDGRIVAYSSAAPGRVTGDTNNGTDVFVYDRSAETTERVSIGTDGTEGDLDSSSPSLSDDGRLVAFDSDATNLVADDTNGVSDVFVHDRMTGATERVSLTADGSESAASSFAPTISRDGRFVAFFRAVRHGFDIVVHDRLEATIKAVSLAAGGAAVNGSSYALAIASDGSVVAFESGASNLVSNDTNRRLRDIFLTEDRPPTTTTSTTSSSTTTASTTTTRMSTTTTATAATTTTTLAAPLDACPLGGLRGLSCVLERELPAPVCAAERLPAKYGRAVARARKAAARAVTASRKRQRRLLKVVAQRLSVAQKAIRRARKRKQRGKRISPSCGEETLHVLAQARGFAGEIRAGSTAAKALSVRSAHHAPMMEYDKISPELKAILDTASDSDLIPIFVILTSPLTDDGKGIAPEDVVDGTRAERLTNLVPFLKMVSQQTAVPLQQVLSASGCIHTESFWIVAAVAGNCVPAVVRQVAERDSVASIDSGDF